MVMLAKGNRTKEVMNACKTYGGFYLGSIGGPAAILAQENILKVEVVDFEELGMEAVRKITIKDFPAFIITDDKGNDVFKGSIVNGQGIENYMNDAPVDIGVKNDFGNINSPIKGVPLPVLGVVAFLDHLS